jgi:hypothetical protein
MDLREIGWCGLDASGREKESVASCSEHGYEPLGSIQGGEFLEQLSDLASQEGLCSMESVSYI